MALYLNAFFDLDFERDLSKFEPISRRACFDYAHDYDFDDLQTDDLWYYMSRMDKPYLEYKRKTAPKPPKEKRPRIPRGKGK